MSTEISAATGEPPPLSQQLLPNNHQVNGALNPPLPHFEEERLYLLNSFGILNEEPIPILDILTRYAAEFCDVPIAGISLVDRHKLVFKSITGDFDPVQCDRDSSFCAHALVAAEEPFVIPDTFLDPRFLANEQVTRKTPIRFYAGARLMTSSGHALGCFFLMDTKPVTLTPDRSAFLSSMASEAMRYLEGEKSKKELARLLHLEKEVYNKLLLATANLATSAPTFDEALHNMVINLDPKLGWLSARIRNMQTGGTTGIYYNPSLATDPELTLIWQRLDTEPSRPRSDMPHTDFINSAPLRPEYSHLVVPVRVRDRLIAVMEFLYPDHRNADPRIRDVFNLIAANLSIVAERELLNMDLKYKSEHDHISGAPNRELFIQRLNRILHEGSILTNRKIILFCFDINGFQSINDDYGYEAGVEILRELTKRAQRVCREDDMIGRLVGGEFLLLIYEKEPFTDLTTIIERVKSSLSGTYHLEEVQIDITLSMGCVVIGPAEGSPDELIRRAEEAMHLVKERTYKDVCIADEQVTRDSLERKSMNRRVEDAVRNNQLTLHYQPIVEMPYGRIVGAEALLRLGNQDGTLMKAAHFIDAMERMHLLEQVDAWVISEILLTLKNNPSILERIPNFYISHNITPAVIGRPSFHDHFISQISHSGIPSSAVRIEITEKALFPDNLYLIKNIESLKQNGIGIALDDFGTGYSNLQIIAKYPIDTIKIDRSFLAGIVPGNSQINALLHSITDIAKNMGCSMVAEGIEQLEQAEHLLSLGCIYGQGYFYGKPMPLKELQALITRSQVGRCNLTGNV
jgi:diguanylate cyclase (GGDEF)-like protein